MKSYPFTSIEKKWQLFWEKNKTFKVNEDNEIPPEKRRYILDMFPYPSGAGLHVGHPEGYTATDIYSRYLRMKGYAVLHPMGFDSFGLPAENYAIKTGTPPEATTEKNIKNFIRQIKSLGLSYDWDRQVETHSPDYYRWTQWIFLKLWEKGLAYEADMPINWCSSCLTGLANEEVKDGVCERCGQAVERRNLKQWLLKITSYADQLLKELDDLNWPESIKSMQRHWIGRSEGANIYFPLADVPDKNIKVYTTRPDTIFGVTYMVLSPEHPLVSVITEESRRPQVAAYQEQARNKSDQERSSQDKEKGGVFTGGYAINPVNGAEIPIWISDYILASYGTGGIMAVPAHDQRDWEFARKFDLPIIDVLQGGDISRGAFTGDGSHINSEFMNGMGKTQAVKTAKEWLEKNNLGEAAVNYKLRDWIFSRQRYWGEPIPLVHCPKDGVVPLPEDQLPLTLPEVEKYQPSGTGKSPLAKIESWVNCTCPQCGGPAKRETNTMPQWAGSCWYYLRYLDPQNKDTLVDPEKEAYWMPVDLYIGGAEHAVLHLLYARFWHKVLHEIGVVSTAEPFQRLINQGMITSFAYMRPNKTLVPVNEVDSDGLVHRERATGEKLKQVKAKMSKSLKNVINPDDIIQDYGADSMRMYEMFMGPLTVSMPWQTKGLTGVHRFLNRIWDITSREVKEGSPPDNLVKLLHKTIKKVSKDSDSLDFNTAIAQMMIFSNEAYKESVCWKELWEPFVLLLAPYTPHLAEEIWEILGHKESLAYAPWPSWDEKLIVDDEKEIVFQVNGKVRHRTTLPVDTPEKEMKDAALADEQFHKWLKGKTITKVITVPNRLVNFVVI